MRNLFAFLAVLLLAAGASAQEPDPKPDPFLDFDLNLAAGWGSVYDNEARTLSRDAQYAVLHADLVGFEWLEARSGVALEYQFAGTVNYAVWQLNRAEVPGTNGRIYGGGDLKFLEGGGPDDFYGNFDLRAVAGTELARVGPGELAVETYLLEENSKIRFAFLYDFDWK